MLDKPVIGYPYRYNFRNRNFVHPRCGEICKVLTVSPEKASFQHVLIEFEDKYKMITDQLHLAKF